MTMTAENGRSPWSRAELPTSKALDACLGKAEEHSVFKKLLGKLFQDTNPELRVALLEREPGSGEAPQQAESIAEEAMLSAHLLCCREELMQSVTQLSPMTEFWRQQKRDS
uniref:zinc finger and BTB domain-containing protein 40 n=1 Tax=Lonchura striata TaxID=40157 RepID=UPI000B4DD8B3|nr:zinc finger and BTB domain-containing protein 40 [Lonchura striata domestica]